MGGNELVVRQVDVFGAATGREELEALTPSVLGGWMGMGPRVREFEVEFRKRLAITSA